MTKSKTARGKNHRGFSPGEVTKLNNYFRRLSLILVSDRVTNRLLSLARKVRKDDALTYYQTWQTARVAIKQELPSPLKTAEVAGQLRKTLKTLKVSHPAPSKELREVFSL